MLSPLSQRLIGLTGLGTSGNNFLDIGQLARLTNLEQLALQEKTLTASALDFLDGLTNLRWLDLHGVPLTDDEFAALQARLHAVSVTR